MFSSHCIITYLTDDQWAVIQLLIPDPPRRPDGKRRPWKDARRDILNGVLWLLLRTGAPWYDMPYRYPHRTKHAIIEDFCNGYVLEYLRRFFKHWSLTCVNAEDWIYQNVTDCTFIVAKKGELKWKD